MRPINDIKKLFTEIKESSFDEGDYNDFKDKDEQDESADEGEPSSEGVSKTSEIKSLSREKKKKPGLDESEGDEGGAKKKGEALDNFEDPSMKPPALPPSNDGRSLVLRVLFLLLKDGGKKDYIDYMAGKSQPPSSGSSPFEERKWDKRGLEIKENDQKGDQEGLQEGRQEGRQEGDEPSRLDDVEALSHQGESLKENILENKQDGRKTLGERRGEKEHGVVEAFFRFLDLSLLKIDRLQAIPYKDEDLLLMDYLLFRQPGDAASDRLRSTFKGGYRLVIEMISGLVDICEVIGRFALFMAMCFGGLSFLFFSMTIGLVAKVFILKLTGRRRIKVGGGLGRTKKPRALSLVFRMLSSAFHVLCRPFIDGRLFLALGVLAAILAAALSRVVLDQTAALLISFSLGATVIWPFFRAAYFLYAGEPFRGRFVASGAWPKKFFLEERPRSEGAFSSIGGGFLRDGRKIRAELSWAYKNRGWIDTGELDPRAKARLDKEFELITAKTLWLLGFSVEHTGKRADGGKDVIARDKKGRLIFVSCKRFNDEVGPSYVRDLAGVLAHERQRGGSEEKLGLLVTTVGFSPGARKFADENGILLARLDDLIEAVKP